jgi:PPP family 3-phenylpropionic acid transporter
MKKTMLPFKGFYFFVYGALAFVLPFLTVYYQSLGLSGQQIGILAGLPSVLTFFSAPVFGAITDITQRHKRILGLSILMVVVGVLLISIGRTFCVLIIMVIFYAIFFSPILPLIDRSVVEILGDDRDDYGKQRLWGAVGWGVLAPISGLAVARGGLPWAFYGAAALFLCLFIVSLLTPIQPVRIQVSYWKGVRQLLSKWQVIIFFVVALVGGMGLSTVHIYFYLYLDSLGASPVTMGISSTIATASELVIMFFASRLLKVMKTRGLIMFGLLMLALRLVFYSMIQDPGLALAVQLMHGVTFAAIWIAGVAYVAEIAPPGLGNTAQGLFTGFVMGLGNASGAFLGGILYQDLGFSLMYLYAGLIVVIALVVFWIACRRDC